VILEKFWNQAATDAKQRPGFQMRNPFSRKENFLLS